MVTTGKGERPSCTREHGPRIEADYRVWCTAGPCGPDSRQAGELGPIGYIHIYIYTYLTLKVDGFDSCCHYGNAKNLGAFSSVRTGAWSAGPHVREVLALNWGYFVGLSHPHGCPYLGAQVGRAGGGGGGGGCGVLRQTKKEVLPVLLSAWNPA